MSEIVTLEDKTNALLKRREVRCLFKGQAGKLSRNNAVSILTEQLKLDKKLVILIALKCETGKTDVKGTFYVYDDESIAKKHLPKYIFMRMLSKEEREKIAEAEKPKKKEPEGRKPEAKAKPEGEKKEVEKPKKEEEKEPKAKAETKEKPAKEAKE
ncbi:MAG: hypothetical protein ACE5J2_08150 [Nitrososphaerales archaeon]